METACLEATEQSLRERPMSEVAQRIAEMTRSQGWGDIQIDLSSA